MAQNPAATIATADTIAKTVFGKVQNLIPKKGFKFTGRVKYDKSKELGEKYEELVFLTGEHGFTYGGTSGARLTLNSSEVATTDIASLTPSSLHFRTEVVIELMAAAQQRGQKAYENYITAMMRESKKAYDKRREVKALFGGSALGQSDSATDATTTSVITMDKGQWMPGVWLNSRNMAIDAYNGATLLNVNADLNVTVVNVKDKKITVTGNATDVALLNSTGVFDLYYKGAYGNDGTGIRTICNLSTGTYLGIDGDVHKDVWNATQVPFDYATDDFTWTTLHSGLEEAAGRGLDGDVIAQVPNEIWGQLNSSLDALRVLDSSYSTQRNPMGHEVDALSYHGVTGKVTIEPSLFTKRGEVMVYPDPADDPDAISLVGTSEPSFQFPGKGGEMLELVANTNAVEYRMFGAEGIWAPAPCKFILFAA